MPGVGTEELMEVVARLATVEGAGSVMLSVLVFFRLLNGPLRPEPSVVVVAGNPVKEPSSKGNPFPLLSETVS